MTEKQNTNFNSVKKCEEVGSQILDRVAKQKHEEYHRFSVIYGIKEEKQN